MKSNFKVTKVQFGADAVPAGPYSQLSGMPRRETPAGPKLSCTISVATARASRSLYLFLCQMVPTSGACVLHLNCSINCLRAEKQYLKGEVSRGRDPSCCNYTKTSGQLARSAVGHCWYLCGQLQLLLVVVLSFT